MVCRLRCKQNDWWLGAPYWLHILAVILKLINKLNQMMHMQCYIVNKVASDNSSCPIYLISYLGAYLGKGTYWQCLHNFDCRETTLSNAANHFKIFLIEFEICLYKHLYFLYIRNPLFPIVVFISMLWQLKVNMFYQQK